MIRKVLYFHYQRSERDGSFVHTMEFGERVSQTLRREGHRLQGLLTRTIEHTGDKPVGFVSELKRKLARFYLRDFRTALLQIISFYKELAILREEKPDVVDPLQPRQCDPGDLAGLPQTRHPGGHRNEFSESRFGSGSLSPTSHVCQTVQRKNRSSLSNGMFAVSDEISEPLRKQAEPGKPVVTIPNGVDIERFDPSLSPAPIRQLLGIPEDRVVFGFVGSFAPWHGVDLLIEAFSILLKEKLPVHLLLVGQTNPLWQAQIDRMRSPEFAPYVSLAGFVPPAEISRNTYVPWTSPPCPTRPITAPLKLFEYMAMSRPTVSVNTGPVAQTMADGKEGLFPPGGRRQCTG